MNQIITKACSFGRLVLKVIVSAIMCLIQVPISALSLLRSAERREKVLQKFDKNFPQCYSCEHFRLGLRDEKCARERRPLPSYKILKEVNKPYWCPLEPWYTHPVVVAIVGLVVICSVYYFAGPDRVARWYLNGGGW